MSLFRARLSGFTLLLLLCGAFRGARAQNPTQTARAFVPSPAALGMGDAAVAVVARTGGFFYNPARLALAPGGARPTVEVSVQPLTTRLDGLSAPYTFLRERLLPVVRSGLETLGPAERRALFDDAQALGAGRTSGGMDGLASATLRAGALGLGAGVFGRSFERYNVRAGGAGIPELVLSRQRDVSLLVSGAFDFSDFGMPGLALGATAKVQHRTLALKDKALDAFVGDERLYFQQGTASGLDLAGLYTVRLGRGPGRLRIGLSLFDVATTGFEYEFQGHSQALDPGLPLDTSRAKAEAQRVQGEAERRRVQQEYELTPSYRAGLAYTAPSLFGRLGETTLALDLQQYTDPGVSRFFNTIPAFVTRLHAGVQVALTSALTLRGGLSQGYPCAGAGLRAGVVHVEYAFAGQEDGRRPGDAPVWQHALRVGLVF